VDREGELSVVEIGVLQAPKQVRRDLGLMIPVRYFVVVAGRGEEIGGMVRG
jgi:hypothetical protein